MRLNCPNCGAEYEVSDGMVPASGRHVQCTACHTRWFIRGEPGPALTEDQIMRRLETWSPGPRPVPAPVPAPMPAAAAPEHGPAPVDQATPAPADPLPRLPPEPPVVIHMPPRPAAPAKPADRPAVAQPAPLSAPARPLPAARPATRLDLGEPAPPPAEPPPPPRSRFGRGFLLALALAAIALAAYLYRDPISARVPAAGPALQTYGATVDRWRAEIEDRLAPLRGG